MRLGNMTLGVDRVSLGDIRVKMFDRERTIIDSFRYLSREVAIKALKRYFKRTGKAKPDIKKPTRYAKTLRTDISPYIAALTL